MSLFKLFLAPVGALAAVTAVVMMTAQPAAAQAGSAVAKPATTTESGKAWTMPRTPDGKPDLQGVYSSATSTPVQRPRNLGAKEFYTPEEYAAAQSRQRPPAAEPGGDGPLAVHYDVAQFGLDRSHATVATNMRTSIITGPDGQIPSQTAAALKRGADRRAFTAAHQWDGPETRPLGERCIMWPAEGPPMMPEGYNSDLQIVQGPGYVAVMQEMIHDVRVIPTDGSPHPPANIHQWMGDSRGHWEGNTLVVETTNFTDRTTLQNASTTENMRVIERFTRTGPETVTYQFSVDDPGTWTKPWSGEYTMTKIDSPIYEYACNEGNYGMHNNLSGARAQEKNAASK